MKKRLLALALAVVMVCGLLPTAALAAATVTEIVPPKYDYIGYAEGLSSAPIYTDGLAPVRFNRKWGFIDITGKEVVPCKYDLFQENFSEGLVGVRVGEYPNYKWGFIDATGKEVVPCQYSDVGNFSKGLAAVCVGEYIDRKWGFVDKTGKEVVPCKYTNDYAPVFHEGLAAVELDGKWGFIDTTGREVVPCKYDGTYSFSDGLAAVKLDGKWGVIDKTGKEVVPCKYDYAHSFDQGLAAVELNDKYGFIDATGKEVIPCTLEYSSVEYFSEGLASVELNGKYGVIDKTGKEVIPCKYDWVSSFNYGIAMMQVGDSWNGEYGFIDTTGKEVVPAGKYAAINSFCEGFAAVMDENRKWGFIDTTGKEVVPCKYENDPERFTNGFAVVELNGKWGVIDTTGQEVVPCSLEYDYINPFFGGFARVTDKDGKHGVLAITSGTAPAQSVQPTATTAYASTQTVTVDGKPVTFYAYALKDANGNDTNYIKLRDVAQILNGSAAQFQVGYDGSITITTKTAYTPNGSEMVQNFTGNQSYAVSASPVTVNGQPTNLEAITLTDASGGGYTYFKLRDLGAALGFNVGWNGGIFIESDKPYDANN